MSNRGSINQDCYHEQVYQTLEVIDTQVNEEKQPQSLEEAVDRLHANMGLNDEILLAAMSEENLIDVHLALGYQIRHEFGLLTGNDALLESCRMISGYKNIHVDEASILIVKTLWEKVQNSNILEDHG